MSSRIKNKIYRLNLSYMIAVLSISLISSLYPQDLDNIKIGLVHSSLTKNLLHDEDKNFYPIQAWELFFLNHKISYEVFDDEGLDDYEFDEVDVLILPSIEVLSDDGFENLQNFLAEGKGLFILGKLGVKDDVGNNRQIDVLQSLSGIQVSEFLDRTTIAKNHILYANNFLTYNLQINTSLIVMNNFPLLYTENASRIIMNLGEYTNSYKDQIISKSGIVKIENEKGRMLWFGFQLSQISVDDDEKEALQKVIFNSIVWLAGKPIAWVNQWPADITSATVITSMINNPNEFTFEMTAPFGVYSIKKNFFLSPNAIATFPVEVDRLKSIGDIHVLYDEYKYFDLSENERNILLENAVQTLRNKTKQSIFGIKYINSNGQQDIVGKTGSNLFDYFINEDNSITIKDKKSRSSFNNYRTIAPAINYPTEQDSLYSINELNDYKNQFDYVQNLGSVLPVTYMNQFSTSNGNMELETFKKSLSYFRSNSTWIATYSAIVKWLIEKENISVKIEEIGEKPVLRVIIENRNKDKVANVGVRLVLPPNYRNPYVVSRNFSLRYDALTRSYNLLVPFLLANQSTTVEVHYDN